MTGEARSAVARHAAQARWQSGGSPAKGTAKSSELCRHTDRRLRRRGRHFGVYLADFSGVFVK
jgi:hypothetical protein